MTIRYKQKRLNMNLFIGIAWFVIAILAVTYIGETSWIDYGYFVVALLYLGQYIYEYRNQYLIIENGRIQKNSLFGKSIALHEITWIKKIAGDYILKTDSQELTINTQLIEQKSMIELNRVLEQLDLAPEKTPFYTNIEKRN